MDNKVLIELGVQVSKIAAQSTVSFIGDKIKTAKSLGDKDRTISALEEIIDDLIQDKRSLIEIAQKYEEITSFQKITEEDVEYITISLVPVLEKVLRQAALMSEDPNAIDELEVVIDTMKPIVSIETFNILQMLGFNFRDAIGQPLTELIQSLILSKAHNDLSTELRISIHEQNKEYYKLLQNPEAVANLEKFSK
ncbi:hypothetical protein PT181_03440 [Erysipelothrix rhusiopathiae]|uniref:hypothetical protein n=1 Tax=Erysipelothrix rhusiopathiae TaxID=1648 RepID=UPI0023B121CE|nr:hypothetical protein [Erysipelothrix rhusiopathiae]MDE8043279.1 hypothetical protein [Erysipelothrix rhusiopathiae]MDE8054370.1 hypothetical protein [Erysipelothrix rhusiopathiae]MDE8056060.1 hypothetical protein [Erysipelothrix rhusiopathiae]MDE8059388.1 hypothetical protein [Erysipelothrix rhusiopathiae]